MTVKNDSLLRSTSLFSLATLMSRVLGQVRESCIAAFVPAEWQGIFQAGIKIPSTFRQLFAEGALSAAFILLLTKVREQEGEAQARAAAGAVFSFLALAIALLVLLAVLLAPVFVPYLLNFPAEEAWKIDAGVQVTQIMFPFLFFIALSAWAMGILNAHRYFFVPALASAFFNLSLIAGLLIGPWFFIDMPLMAFLGGAVIIGGLLQFGSQLFQLRRVGFFPPSWQSPFHPKVKQLLGMLAPSVFGLAVYQINALITQTYFASTYGGDGIAQITYAFRLIQFPLGVVGIALATASFPRIAQYIAQERGADASRTLENVLKYLLLLILPTAAGYIVLGEDLIGLIFNHGEFRREGWLSPTYNLLAFYSLGLISFAGVSVLARTSQAHNNFTLPVVAGLLGFATNITLCSIFVKMNYDVHFLALSSSLASTVNVLTLCIVLKWRWITIRMLALTAYTAKVLIACVLMGAACWAVNRLLPAADEQVLLYMLRCAAGIAISLAVYAAVGYLLFRRELMALLRLKG